MTSWGTLQQQHVYLHQPAAGLLLLTGAQGGLDPHSLAQLADQLAEAPTGRCLRLHHPGCSAHAKLVQQLATGETWLQVCACSVLRMLRAWRADERPNFMQAV